MQECSDRRTCTVRLGSRRSRSFGPLGTTADARLDEAAYETVVHPVVERACGTADCHGKLPRGLRVYGATALRLEGATGPTTLAEIDATYASILGLEPEKLNHRGGVSLRKGEAAELCVSSWLLGQTDAVSCMR